LGLDDFFRADGIYSIPAGLEFLIVLSLIFGLIEQRDQDELMLSGDRL
jgi:hypothetical protein